jgi:hypothetical protein
MSEAEYRDIQMAVYTSAWASDAESESVPRANVELFRKHQEDIKKYAMHGLALLGF